MTVYELDHLFVSADGTFYCDPKGLGMYSTYENALRAMESYKKCPGFQENPNGFSLRERPVLGAEGKNALYEVLVYFHTEDFECETTVELGLYGSEREAGKALEQYCGQTERLLRLDGMIAEKIINKIILDKMEWAEGFTNGA